MGVLPEVGDHRLEDLDAVACLAETSVACEAENAADSACGMVMIDVDRRVRTADGACAALLLDQELGFGRVNSVPELEAIALLPPVEPLLLRLHDAVVARLAITGKAVLAGAILGKGIARLCLPAARATLGRLDGRGLEFHQAR